MPGPELMSPGSAHRTDLKSGVESDNTAPKKKKGMLGRIKSSLSTTFGLRKSTATDSPTQKALVSVEPEITDIAGNKQENDDEDEDNNDSKESQNNETDNEGSLDRTDSDEVLQFQEPLSVPELDSDVKSGSLEHEMKSEAASDEVKQHDSDSGDSKNANREQTGQGEGDGAAAEAEHEELLHSDGKKEAIPEQEIYEEKAGYKDVPEEEEDHLEVFDDGGGNQQLQESPRHEPEYDEHEDQGDESDMNSPSEPLMIIGTALQGPSAADAFSFEQNEIQDDGPETVVLPTVSEQPFSSPVKRARPGPMLGLAAIWSPRSPFSPRHNLPDGPLLQGVREEAAEESKQTGTTPRQFSGRRNVNDSMNQEAPILSSAFSQGVNHAENALEEQREENRNDEPDDNEDTPDADSFDAGAIISAAFGERIVNMLSADPWGDRQDGFDAVKRAVKKADVSTTDSMTRQRLLCATISAVQCGVEDKVAPVMYCSLDCLRAVLKEFSRVPNDQVCSDSGENSAAALNTQLSSLVGALVKKLGDSNKRTQREATQALVRIARSRSLRALPHLLLHLSGREIPPRRQLETLRRLMQELDIVNAAESSHQKQQLTVETVLEFVAPSLKIAEEKTRKAAVELLADLQTRTGNSTAWQAQLARAGAVKPEMLRVIIRRVEEMVGTREQQQQEPATSTPAEGSAPTNQTEDQVDDEAAFPPAELVDVPQEDANTAIALLEKALLAAQNIVGPVGWRKLSSKTWSDRKDALLDAEKVITEAKSDLRDVRPAFGTATQTSFVAYSALLHRALSDSIAPVVNTAMDTYVTLVKVFGPRIEWREEDVRDITLLTLVRLLAAIQKSNTRTTRAACRAVLKLARLPNARHPLRYVLSCVFGSEGSSACDPQVQMHLLRLLVPEFGFQADGLGASRVLDAVSKGLSHNSARLRRSAADVALSAQRLLGRDFVLAKLEGVKPVTLKELEKSFVDGVGGSGSGERPQTVHVETSAPAANGVSDLPPVSFGGQSEFPTRRLLSSAPVGHGRLQCTPNEVVSAGPSRASVLSNEEESLMESILGDGGDF